MNSLLQWNIQGNNNFVRQYKLKPFELPPGDELIKLYMYNYLTDKNNKLSDDERIKLAIKYQIFIEGTSLFAEVELSEKISTPMISNYNQYNSINIIYDEISNENVDLNIPILHKDENPSLSINKLNEEDNKSKKLYRKLSKLIMKMSRLIWSKCPLMILKTLRCINHLKD